MEPSTARMPRRRLVPLAAWVGCALLAGSLAGASWSVNSSPSEAPKPEPIAENPSRTNNRSVSQGHVDVETGITSLYPLQPGRVKKVFVRDNDEVAADAPLFQMEDTIARAQVAEAKADLEAAEAALELAQQLPEQHEARIEAQMAAVEAREQELAGAKIKQSQATRLSEKKLGSSDETKMAGAAVKALEAAVKGEEAKLQLLEASDPEAGVAQAERAVEAKKAQLEKAEYALKECTIRAPRKGRVLRITVTEGEALGPNPRQPALQFCPDVPRIVRAEVEQEFADRLALGQTAKVHDDSSGEMRWTGKVVRISDWYTHRRSIMLEPLQFNDVRTLECIIAIDAGGPPLRIGQRVRVTLENAQ